MKGKKISLHLIESYCFILLPNHWTPPCRTLSRMPQGSSAYPTCENLIYYLIQWIRACIFSSKLHMMIVSDSILLDLQLDPVKVWQLCPHKAQVAHSCSAHVHSMIYDWIESGIIIWIEKIDSIMMEYIPGDSKWPFDPLLGGHLTLEMGGLTIPNPKNHKELPGT